MKLFLFVDLDGTLFDIRHRQHLAVAGAWDEFHALAFDDSVNQIALRLINTIVAHENVTLCFLTGRPESMRSETKVALEEGCCLYEHEDYVQLLMRGRENYDSDPILKSKAIAEFFSQPEIQDEFVSEDKRVRDLSEIELKDLVLVLEDRDKVVSHLRDQGYVVWQVAEGVY